MSAVDHSALRYAMVGGLNTLSGLLFIYLGMLVFELNDVVANALGYTLGFVISFNLNKRWTFRHDGARLPALLRFAAVMAVAYLGNLGTMLVLVGLGMDSYFAQAAGVVPYAVIGYLGNRFVAFVPIDSSADGSFRS